MLKIILNIWMSRVAYNAIFTFTAAIIRIIIEKKKAGKCMKNNYVSLERVLEMASEVARKQYRKIPGKKIMFESCLDNGEQIVLCTPTSKYHETIEAYWIDLTKVQCDLMDTYENGIFIFRLEGEKLCLFNWCDLKPFLTEKSMRYSEQAKDHWKLRIYNHYIKVLGNPDNFNVDCFFYKEKNSDQ